MDRRSFLGRFGAALAALVVPVSAIMAKPSLRDQARAAGLEVGEYTFIPSIDDWRFHLYRYAKTLVGKAEGGPEHQAFEALVEDCRNHGERLWVSYTTVTGAPTAGVTIVDCVQWSVNGTGPECAVYEHTPGNWGRLGQCQVKFVEKPAPLFHQMKPWLQASPAEQNAWVGAGGGKANWA